MISKFFLFSIGSSEKSKVRKEIRSNKSAINKYIYITIQLFFHTSNHPA